MKIFRNIWGAILAHKRRSILIVVVLFVLLLIFRPRPQKVIATQPVTESTLTQSISATGSVDAEALVNLTFKVGGRLTYLGVQKGDTVQAGQTIATTDQRTTQENLQTALRNYSEQRNTFDTTQQNNQNRTPDQALNDQMKRVLQNNQYDLDKSVISVELQSIAAEDSVLTTPISGVVTRADAITTGVNVTPTTTFTIADPNTLVFKIDVDEADVGRVSEGQVAKINLDSFPNTTLSLPVTSIDFVNHTTSTGENAYTVQVQLPVGTGMNYRVGMQGDAEIVTAERLHVLIIPISSLVASDTVIVKTKTGYAKRKVVLGLQNDTSAEVKKGLAKGEEVVLQPSDVPAKVLQKS